MSSVRTRPKLVCSDRSRAGIIEHHWRFERYPRLTIVQSIAGDSVTKRYLADGVTCASFEAAVAKVYAE